ncbi:MAG TPA: protein kinase [Trebonia sp.]|nr:protein kinase [Trebonia sp.]
MPPMTGRVIAGRYNLQTPIGRGAMGVVWRAHDRLLDREVAVKEVVISALIGAEERRNAYQRTLREARTAARLSHRGVVAVYDVAEEDGRPWIVMELVPSQSLDQLLVVESRLPAARAGRIGQQLLSALAAAHVAGVLHRDVKPSNVLIATNKSADGWDERAVLTDFGIAQFEGDPRLTQTGMVMGSPGFTAPERIRGSDATPASDLWSLGATIYAAVEGRGPYENRGGAITTMSAIINEDAPLAPHAGQLAPVIAALLRRDPAARPSASLASRMFAQALPQLAEASEEPPSMAHPPTVRSVYVPPAAAPVASAPVTAPDDARPREKATPAAEEEPAEETPAAEAEEVAQEAPAEEEPAEASSEDSAAEAEAAESEPEAELVPVSAAVAEAEPAAEGEGGQAVETAQFQASAPESAAVPVPVPGPPPADDPGAEPKAAAAAVLDADSDDDESDSRAADTVIPRKGSAAPQVPGARVSPSAAVPAQPQTAKPEPPKPTFTAAKPAERVGPSFSAATPARPATPGRATPGRPVPPLSSQRPAYGQSSAAQGGYQTPGRGNTAPLPPAAGTYQPQGTQYAGPSQPPPDLARQYPPGTGGGGRRHDGGQRRQLIWLVVAVIIAAAIGVGTALALNHGGSNGDNAGNAGSTGQPTTIPSVADTTTNIHSVDALNDPSSALPGAGWTTQTVTQAQAGSVAAGFSIAVPPNWKTKQNGLQTDFTGPGDLLVEVDLTAQSTTNMLTAATQVKNASLNRFPGYKQQNLQAVPVRHTEGAFWKFTWKPTSGSQDTVDDIFFAQGTPSGVQNYAIYLRSPSSTFSAKSLPLFEKMLRTFKVVPNNT